MSPSRDEANQLFAHAIKLLAFASEQKLVFYVVSNIRILYVVFKSKSEIDLKNLKII